jgi:hypothetical protein
MRQQREESLRRQGRDADQLQRLGMARLSALVQRDPQTGQPRLDPSVSPRDAVAVYKLGLELEDRLSETSHAGSPEDLAMAQVSRMATEELRELLELARERADEDPGGVR